MCVHLRACMRASALRLCVCFHFLTQKHRPREKSSPLSNQKIGKLLNGACSSNRIKSTKSSQSLIKINRTHIISAALDFSIIFFSSTHSKTNACALCTHLRIHVMQIQQHQPHRLKERNMQIIQMRLLYHNNKGGCLIVRLSNNNNKKIVLFFNIIYLLVLHSSHYFCALKLCISDIIITWYYPDNYCVIHYVKWCDSHSMCDCVCTCQSFQFNNFLTLMLICQLCVSVFSFIVYLRDFPSAVIFF